MNDYVIEGVAIPEGDDVDDSAVDVDRVMRAALSEEELQRLKRETRQRNYANRVRRGLCAKSPGHGPDEPGHVKCAACNREQRERDALRYQRRVGKAGTQ